MSAAMMKGYDPEAAIAFMLPKFQSGEFKSLAADLPKLARAAIECDMAYMTEAGVIDAAGQTGEAYYDDDDAFEYLAERLPALLNIPNKKRDELDAFIEQYMDLQEAFMTEAGLVGWE